MPEWVALLMTGILGALVGSFLNVCIVRIPRDESIILPRSQCAKCRHSLAWWENIPLLSYFFLRCRCRHCKRPISCRYPIVELLTLLLSLLTWIEFHDPLRYAVYFFLFIAPLIAISFIDLEHMIIPDTLSLPGIAVGLGTRFLFSPHHWEAALLDGILGILVGGGIFLAVAWGYERLKGVEGLGGGDVKLMAVFGAFFGWQAVLAIMLLGSLLGLLVGIVFMIAFRKGLQYAIPFGPFLSGAAILYLFWGPEFLGWYFSLLPW